VVDSGVMQRRMVLVVAVVLAQLAASPASAGGIVLEAYTGERPADAPRVISPILDELASRGYTTGDTLARSYEARVSRLAQSVNGLAGDFAAQVEGGFKAWVAGHFEEAIRVLAPLVEQAHANTAVIARDQALREPLLKALIVLALAQQRTGDPGAARTTFGEVLRAYPDTVVPRAMYGAEAYDLFEQTRREVAAAGHGTLAVRVTDDTAVVFVDELYRAVGTTSVELPPGEYRVCVLLNKQPSRSHHIVVRANETVTLAIDPRLDQAVRTTGWTGLTFAAAGDREAHEGSFAADIANSTMATAVAVVGIDRVRGHPAVVGSLVSLQTGHELRRASVALEPDPPTERLKALARYLAGDEPAEGLDVQRPTLVDDRAQPIAAEHDESRTRWAGWQWLAATGAAGALAVGGYLLYEDGRCESTHAPGTPCPEVYSNTPGDWIALAAGAALAGTSVYLFATGGRPSTKAAALIPTHGGAFAALSLRF
jgi:hypothetical protein